MRWLKSLLEARWPVRHWPVGRCVGSVIAVTAAACLACGCAAVDTLDGRADTINRSMSDYRNAATLLNIVRASQSEPMDFVTLTGATGHNTFTASEGMPSFIVGPHTAAVPIPARNYNFGPNTFTETASNDFNVSHLDDPQSYSALMTPIDAATIAFFQRENIPLSVLLPLVISEIRIIVKDVQNKTKATVYSFFTDQTNLDPSINHIFFCEIDKYCTIIKMRNFPPDKLLQCRNHEALCVSPAEFILAYLESEGIRFQIPAGSIPGPPPQGQTPPSARICFDRLYRSRGKVPPSFAGWVHQSFNFPKDNYRDEDIQLHTDDEPLYSDLFAESDRYKPGHPPLPDPTHFACDDQKTPQIKPASSSQNQQQKSAGPTDTSSVAPTNILINSAGAVSKTQNMQSAKNTSSYEAPMYEFTDGHMIIQLFTRSTWGAYQFLGNLIRAQDEIGTPNLFIGGINEDSYLFLVTKGGATGCFSSITYYGTNYCIPTSAFNSKRIISVLHELTNLNTRPNNTQQPNSSTVRTTP